MKCTATDAAGNTASGSFIVNVSAFVANNVVIQFVGERGSPTIRWEGSVGTGLVAGSTSNGLVEWLAADGARYGNPAVTLSMDMQSKHIGRLMAGSLTATRGNARIQFSNVVAPIVLNADGTITTLRARYGRRTTAARASRSAR